MMEYVANVANVANVAPGLPSGNNVRSCLPLDRGDLPTTGTKGLSGQGLPMGVPKNSINSSSLPLERRKWLRLRSHVTAPITRYGSDHTLRLRSYVKEIVLLLA